ncbi:MAG: ArsA family ATPase [Geobacter sp.]|nr:ArsA family ATPase [Geobacter sp.]
MKKNRNVAGPGFLDNPALRLILFGGKGGCGKTTSAAAASICLARQSPGKKVLLASTDPAHSLGDSFERKVGGELLQVGELENLWLLEMDARKLFEDFKGKNAETIKKLAERGTYFEKDDIESFFILSLPGLDEVMAVMELARILKRGDFDLIILDTAPTGHTLRMLALPAQMRKWVEVFDLMQEKHRFFQKRFRGRCVRDEADEFLKALSDDLSMVESLFRDNGTVEFVPVTIPEPAAIEETHRLLVSLSSFGILVRSVIVNRVIGNSECPYCSSRKREVDGRLQEIEGIFSGCNLLPVPQFPHAIQGMESLGEFAELLFGHEKFRDLPEKEGGQSDSIINFAPSTFQDAVSDFLKKKELEFLFFGGKGGVGKTTLAAAAALRIARGTPGRKVLILSTDPAHSLSDCFGYKIGNDITAVIESSAAGHVYALEMDALQMLDEFRNGYRSDIDEIFNSFAARVGEIAFDREVIRGLVDLFPPGLDEIMAIKRMLELRGAFDLFIIDTAPTGHALRLLETPEIALDWLKTILRLLLKYKDVVRLGGVAEKMMNLLRDVKSVQAALTDCLKTEFVAVTIPESLGLLETGRLLSGIGKLGINSGHIFVNMMFPPTSCSFCTAIREEQMSCLRRVIVQWGKGYEVAAVPQLPHPVKGLGALEAICDETWEK